VVFGQHFLQSRIFLDFFPKFFFTFATRNMAELTFSQFSFLKDLGIEEENMGCYNGKWFGNGPVYTTLNPSTGKPLARIRGVCTYLLVSISSCVNFF
jgi:hypothetical protein